MIVIVGTTIHHTLPLFSAVDIKTFGTYLDPNSRKMILTRKPCYAVTSLTILYLFIFNSAK